jgi:hypothetical protein
MNGMPLLRWIRSFFRSARGRKPIAEQLAALRGDLFRMINDMRERYDAADAQRAAQIDALLYTVKSFQEADSSYRNRLDEAVGLVQELRTTRDAADAQLAMQIDALLKTVKELRLAHDAADAHHVAVIALLLNGQNKLESEIAEIRHRVITKSSSAPRDLD